MTMHEGYKPDPSVLSVEMWKEATELLAICAAVAMQASMIGYCKVGHPVVKAMDRFIAGERTQNLWREIMALQ